MRLTGQRGFTLIELLVVVFVFCNMAVLSAFLLHRENFAPERHNAQRWSDIAEIAQGFNRYVADNGTLPDDLPTKSALTIGSESINYNICDVLVPKYVKEIPIDPVGGLDFSTKLCADGIQSLYLSGYTIRKTGERTIVISAPRAELKQKISITRKY